MSLANRFVEYFIDEIRVVEKEFDRDAWAQIWKSNELWYRLMMFGPTPRNRSVLEVVSDRLGLVYRGNGEPFRLDACMTSHAEPCVGSTPFPMTVAIEHENDIRTIREELARLIHLRCPLKVCITYSLSSHADRNPRGRIKQAFTELAAKMASVSSEDQETEYLFLLGEEKAPFQMDWSVLAFSVENGPEIAEWSSFEHEV